MLDSIGNVRTANGCKVTTCGICFLVLLGGIALGGILINESFKDKLSEEVEDLNSAISHWDDTVHSSFSSYNMKVQLANETYSPMTQTDSNDWVATSPKLNSYQTLIHKASNLTYPNSSFTTKNTDLHGKKYDIVGNLTIDNSNEVLSVQNVRVFYKDKYKTKQKFCRKQEIGCWDSDTHMCYYHYRLKTLNVVVNETTGLIPEWFSVGWEDIDEFEEVKWTDCTLEPSYSDFTFDVEVRASNDPYIFALRNGIYSLSPEPMTLLICGVVLIVLAVLVMIIPCIFFCRKPRNTLLYQSNFEMREYS